METHSPAANVTVDEASVDSSTAEPVVTLSVLEKFLSLRGLTQAQGRVTKPPKLTADALGRAYTKRRHGRKTLAQRAALREPEDLFRDSVDVYVPRKRTQELMNLHKDEQQVNGVFLSETRALSFEREVLDKVVGDRGENREQFEERLWQLLAKERGLQPVEEDEDDAQVEHAPDVEREQKCNQDSNVAQM